MNKLYPLKVETKRNLQFKNVYSGSSILALAQSQYIYQ